MNTESRLMRAYYWSRLETGVPPESATSGPGYHPELLYVECRLCGKPVLWEKGRTRAIVRASGMDMNLLDECCLILSDGCPQCRPGHSGFQLHMVRLTSLSTQDFLLMEDAKGSA